ncbi:unnamed protein product [Victoria cruziana]
MAFCRVSLVVLGLLLAGPVWVNGQGCTEQDLANLGVRCRQYVARDLPPAPPSDGCCNLVRSTDLVCACGRITPGMESMIDMQKVVDVAKKCGKPIPSGTRCGSITVPRA